ncbi:hypothetical protein AK812_SmicGene35843 [Symbiodinium microadriaticum]|uniref:Uncharacterized protein n=1 Tax=Symbiodinium microadriaticum TaxID=2951 RepID=A0A1Q9CKE4_SYMMI|nr:hypothetical protein AK812_SmicGene35843 [Symbiodinium microadriaticum]
MTTAMYKLLHDFTSQFQSPTASQTLKAILSGWFGHSTVLVATSSEAHAASLGLTTMIRLTDGGMESGLLEGREAR